MPATAIFAFFAASTPEAASSTTRQSEASKPNFIPAFSNTSLSGLEYFISKNPLNLVFLILVLHFCWMILLPVYNL